MKVFLIIVAVLAVITALILSLKAELTVIFDNGWYTKIKVLFFEKELKLTELLSFLVSPDEKGKEAAENAKQKKEDKKNEKEKAADEGSADRDGGKGAEEADQEADQKREGEESGTDADASAVTQETQTADSEATTPAVTEAKPEEKPAKKSGGKNPIRKILDKDGVVGLLQLLSNVLQTVNTAATTFIKGLHIYSLYVKMIIGGGGAADIAEKYGAVCGWYYPLKGIILNQMRVDQYDDLIQADFIAPRSEYEFQFIGSISVGLLMKSLLKAGKTFIVNYIKNR